MDNKNYVITKMVSELQLKLNINPFEANNIISKVLENYELNNINTSNALSDLPEKVQYFLDTKLLDGLSQKSINTYRSELSLFCKFCSKSIVDITINDLRSYISTSQNNHALKRTTINNKITILRSFFQFLTAEELLIKDPSVKLKTLKIDLKSLREELNEEELEFLRQACDTLRDKSIVEFLVSSGCRVTEAVNIKISDIDWNERSIVVLGKGNKQRKVYFSVKAKLMLKSYIIQRKGDSDNLFISERSPYLPINKDQIEKIVRQIAARTNIKKPVTPHVLRHTFASLALQRGVDISIIQKLLGHESVNTTQIYASTSEQMLHNAYNQYLA